MKARRKISNAVSALRFGAMGWPKRAMAISAILVALAVAPGQVSAGDADAAVFDAQLEALAQPPADAALKRIPKLGHKLLALRSYVRLGPRVAKRWSWSEEQVEAWKGSPHHTALLEQIDAVKAHFAAANPGYEIYVHNTLRTLDEQIHKWNSNKSVAGAAAAIEAAYGEKFSGAEVSHKALAAWLRGYRPPKRANLAAPGLTLHGRGSAIDFQVMKDGAIYAGANSRQIENRWGAEGWADKLKASITAAGPSFHGPLERPNEPWHYEFRSDLAKVK